MIKPSFFRVLKEWLWEINRRVTEDNIKTVRRTMEAIVLGECSLPGEIGRFFKRRGWEKGIHNWVADMTAAGATQFIALSPFPRDPLGTGTGKEEEE